MRKPYTLQQKQEAVALATVVGSEAAGKQLGMDERTIVGWCVRAGRAPADAIVTADWRALGELARSQVASKLVSGKISAREAAIVAGIASRNERDAPSEPEPEAAPEAQDWAEALEDVLAVRYPDVDPDVALAAVAQFMESEPLDGPAEDPVALVARLPESWADWHAERAAVDAAEQEADRARVARSVTAWPAYMAGHVTAEQRADWIATGVSPFADELAAAIAAAEAYLRTEAA